MMMARKFITALIVFILNIQFVFADVVGSYNSTNHKLSMVERSLIDSYISKLDRFKRDLRGATDCPEVIEAILDQKDSSQDNMSVEKKSSKSEYQSLVSSLQENSCRTSTTIQITDEDINDDELPNGCLKIDGFLSDISYELSLLEADENIANFNLGKLQSRINSFIRKGLGYKIKLTQFLSYNLDDEVKREIIIEYNQNVALSLRDMYFLLGAETKKYKNKINDLLPIIPSGLFEANTEDFSKLILGKDPTTDPMTLDLEELTEGLQLIFDDHGMVSRDIKTIMEYPAAKNYLYALRVMSVQMIANQIKNYNILIGDNNEAIKMPNSCVNNKENGIWQSEFDIPLNDGIAAGVRENLIRSHGLLYDGYDSLLYSYFIENAEVDLVSDGIISSGTVEFDNYKNARAAVEQGYLKKGTVLRPVHDDVDAFPLYMDMKRGQAQDVYYKETHGGRSNLTTKVYMYKDISLLNNILTPTSENDIAIIKNHENGVEHQLNFSQVNASVFMKNKMIAKGIIHPEDLITESISKQLKKNNIKISLPSLHSPAGYRNWGLRTLTKSVGRMIGTKDKSLYTLCRAYGNYFCKGTKDPFAKVYTYLNTLNLKGRYLPLDQLKGKNLEKNYYFLGLLWNKIRDTHKKLPEAIINEEEYLSKQMLVGSPLAMIRLGYLIAKEDIENLVAGKKKTYKKTRRGSRITSDYSCYTSSFNGQLTRLNKAAKILGINKPLRPGFLSSILSRDESLYLFNKVLSKVNSKSTHTFSAKINEQDTAYDIISRISSQTLSTVDSVNHAVNNYLDSNIDKGFYKQIEEVFYSAPARKVDFYYELAKEKDHKKRQEMFEARADEFGIDDDLMLKEEILNLDSALKKPLYEEVIVRAAKVQKEKSYKKLDDLCKADFNDHEKVKEYYFSTLKIQNKMNEALGITKMPEQLMDRIHSMVFEEKVNMVKGISSFIIGAGALALLASCPVTLGAGCIAAGGLGVAAGGTLGVSVMVSEYQMKKRADNYETHVSEMEDIGLTDLGASYNVSRSWAWTILSSLDVIPLMGIVSRGINVSSRMGREAITSIYHNAGKLGIKGSLKHSSKSNKVINEESEVNLAKLVLGYTTYTDKFTRLIKGKNLDDAAESLDAMNLEAKAHDKIDRNISTTRKLFADGKISRQILKKRTKIILNNIKAQAIGKKGGLYTYISDVAVNYTKADIDKRTAKTLVTYFNGNPKELLKFLGTYSKRFKANEVGKGSKVANARFRYLKAKRGEYGKGTNWIVSMWNENTYNMGKNHLKFKKLQSSIVTAKNSRELEKALVNNMDDFVDIFTKTPLRLIDIPYLIVQGGPHMAQGLLGRLPGLKKMGMSVIIRKIAQSRSRLVGESVKNQARGILGMKKVMAADSIAQIMKGLQVMSVKMARNSIPSEGQKILKELNKIRMSIIMEVSNGLVAHPEIVGMFAARGIHLMDSKEIPNVVELKRLLFKTNTDEENVLADMLWGIVDIEKLLTKKAGKRKTQGVWQQFFTAEEKLLKDEFQFIVSRGMNELVEDTTVEGVQQYVLMSKILLLNKRMGDVELF
jgi:hypothetical protein